MPKPGRSSSGKKRAALEISQSSDTSPLQQNRSRRSGITTSNDDDLSFTCTKTVCQKCCLYFSIFLLGIGFAFLLTEISPKVLNSKLKIRLNTGNRNNKGKGTGGNDENKNKNNKNTEFQYPPNPPPPPPNSPSSSPSSPGSVTPPTPPTPSSPPSSFPSSTSSAWLSYFDPDIYWTATEEWMKYAWLKNKDNGDVSTNQNPKDPFATNLPSNEDPCLNYQWNDREPSSSSIGMPCDLNSKYLKTSIDSEFNGGEIRLIKNNSATSSSSSTSAPPSTDTNDNNNHPSQSSLLESEPLTEKLLFSISMLNFYRLYRNTSLSFLGNPESDSPVLCFSALLHTQNCRPRIEAFPDCVLRLGGSQNVEQIVPRVCIRSKFWRWFKSHPKISGNKGDHSVSWSRLKRGVIPTSTVAMTKDERQTYVPAAKRTPSPFTQPVYCSKTHVVMHPIGYGVPKNTIADKVSRTKSFDFMPLMPARFAHGFVHKFGIEDESLMHEWYSSSYFAWSNRRGGFEVLRHLEILASGCIPFMPDIEIFPKNSLTHYPKKLLSEVLSMPGVNHIPKQNAHPGTIPKNHEWYENNGDNFHFKKRGTIINSKFNRTLYFEYADKLLDWTKKYLTCGAVVAGMLERMGKQNVNHVLISALTIDLYQIWQGSSDSYMVNTILQGFDELGINVTIVARDQVLWRYRYNGKTLAELNEYERGNHLKNTRPYNEGLYGQGMTYKARSYNREYDEKLTKEDRVELTRRILKKEFDLVVFDFVENEMKSHAPFIESVSITYDKSEVAIVDQFDHHVVKWYEYPKLCDMATIFVRELDEKIVCIIDYGRAKPKMKCPIPKEEEVKKMFVIEQPRGWV